MKVVTICGSMKFQKEMIDIALKLEAKEGYCVLQCVYADMEKNFSEEEYAKIVEAHWKKIEISDAIFVMNVGGYIGSSTKNEIIYAIEHDKEILYLEPIE